MTDLERFNAIVRGDTPDYVPIFGFSAAPGMTGAWCQRTTYDRLVETGMPDWIAPLQDGEEGWDGANWQRYWGTTSPLEINSLPAEPERGFEQETRIDGDTVTVESESGEITKQVRNNDDTYSMPEFVVYPVRDRKSWEFYRDRMTPGGLWPPSRMASTVREYSGRTLPLSIKVGSTWGEIRNMMGTEAASIVLYDDPGLVREIIEWFDWKRSSYIYPLVELLRPEILQAFEDNCYNKGMLISPEHFREFCSPSYRKITAVARDCNVGMVAIDTDGNAVEMVKLAVECGVNAMFPFEVKGANDLFEMRKRYPEFILMGWLEKECVNLGNESRIENEIMSKVPALLETGRYFPNGDHGLQPLVTFPNLCRFMRLLHEATGNPEGEFPRS